MEKTEKAVKVFLDASVLVTAALSRSGGSFRVLNEAAIRGFVLVTSRYAYREAERTIQNKYPNLLDIFYHSASLFGFMPDAPPKFVERLMKIIDFKDAPVLAGALVNKVQVLITLDRKHFLENPKLKEVSPAL